jgi:hypothetical protein
MKQKLPGIGYRSMSPVRIVEYSPDWVQKRSNDKMKKQNIIEEKNIRPNRENRKKQKLKS